MIMHKELAGGKWFNLSLVEQMANIGSDIIRTITWKHKNNEPRSRHALNRALELLDLTAADPKNKLRLKEVLRVREMLVDYFMFTNQYASSDKQWEKYFYSFNYAAALRQGR